MMQQQYHRARLSSRKGFTLVEMLVAMVIILVALLGLVQVTLLSIDGNLRTLYRDEAVRLAEERMNMLKSKPVTDTPITGLPPGNVCDAVLTQRSFRNISKGYTVCTSINNLGDSSRKSLQVFVGWDHKGDMPPPHPVPTDREFQYTMTSIVGSAM